MHEIINPMPQLRPNLKQPWAFCGERITRFQGTRVLISLTRALSSLILVSRRVDQASV